MIFFLKFVLGEIFFKFMIWSVIIVEFVFCNSFKEYVLYLIIIYFVLIVSGGYLVCFEINDVFLKLDEGLVFFLSN